MLYRKLQAVDPREGVRQLLLKIRLIVGELPDEIRAYLPLLLFVLNDAHPSEHDYAVDVQRPLTVPAEALVHHAVADLVAGGDGVDLMPDLRAVEVQTIVLLTIPMVKGNPSRFGRTLPY